LKCDRLLETGNCKTEVSMMLSHEVGSLPFESFLSGYDRLAGCTLDPGPVARLAAVARGYSLDRELAAGADPASSEQLAARAARLTSTRSRRLLADGLERLERTARGRQRRWWAIDERSHVVDNAEQIGELAELLRADTPLYAPGIALVRELLGDGNGPAYHGGAATLAMRLREARAAMMP
jgi:hypothetical protein